MSRYAAMFDALAARGEGAFGGFVMLGDPDLQASAALLDALVEGGADMIEVGIPFSDPIADGPTIQAAADRALARGVTPADCFALLARFRARHPDVPVGVLTYANLVLARGRDRFYGACRDCGVDSVLVADVPAFEAEPFVAAARAHDVAPVLIAAAATPFETLKRVAALGEGYTYCVARSGVTGAEVEMKLDHGGLFEALRDLGAPPPVLGFGISTPAHVRAGLDAGAAGVISGSAIVKRIEAALDDPARHVAKFVSEMKEGTLPLANWADASA
jgi:tryptophan synthase alpha chain